MAPPASKSKERSKITVAILEDNETLIKGMQLELDQPDIHICGVGKEVEDFLAKVKTCQPMIAIIDLRIWRDQDAGFTAIQQAKELSSQTRYIVYTFYDQPEQFHKAINLGIKAFVTKNIYEISLDKVVHIVAEGGTYYGELLSQYLDRVKEGPLALDAGRQAGISQKSEISGRELEILRLLDTGKTRDEIASLLSISTNTVKAHTKNIREKLAVRTTTEALRLARLRGIL